MSDIPEDIMKAARKHCDLAGVTPRSDMRVHCEHVAAFAILAERERCAAIAREFPLARLNACYLSSWDRAVIAQATAIATATAIEKAVE